MKCYTDMTAKELLDAKFGLWTEESQIYLIPAKLLDKIPDGTTLYCIDGKPVVKGIDYVDLDTRFGCLAYGIKIKPVPEKEQPIFEKLDLLKDLPE